MSELDTLKFCARRPRKIIGQLDPNDFAMRGGFILKEIGKIPQFFPSAKISTDVLTGSLPNTKPAGQSFTVEQALTATRSRPVPKAPPKTSLNL